MIIVKKILFIHILFLITVPFVQADPEGENAKLALIIHELHALTPLVQEAEALANKDSRIQFQYDWLSLDLERIKSAILEHITAPRVQPRSFPPLKGDYRR